MEIKYNIGNWNQSLIGQLYSNVKKGYENQKEDKKTKGRKRIRKSNVKYDNEHLFESK